MGEWWLEYQVWLVALGCKKRKFSNECSINLGCQNLYTNRNSQKDKDGGKWLIRSSKWAVDVTWEGRVDQFCFHMSHIHLFLSSSENLADWQALSADTVPHWLVACADTVTSWLLLSSYTPDWLVLNPDAAPEWLVPRAESLPPTYSTIGSNSDFGHK